VGGTTVDGVQKEAKSFSAIAAYGWTFSFLIRDEGSQSMQGMEVTKDYLPLMGLRPALGRGFEDSDFGQGPVKVILLGYEFWQRTFNGDPKIIGRSPDIIVTPNVGVTYIGPGSAVGDHGGFGHDDTNVMLLVASPLFSPKTVSNATTTAQVAPTVLKALGLDPQALDAVRIEGTAVLPKVAAQLDK
jgi:MacB-like periplasmic core domain